MAAAGGIRPMQLPVVFSRQKRKCYSKCTSAFFQKTTTEILIKISCNAVLTGHSEQLTIF